VLKRINLTDPNPPKDRRGEPECIRLLTTEGGEGGDWGDLEPLRGTTWAAGVEIITSRDMDHALHGYLLPLQRALGRSPHYSGKRVSEEEGRCSLAEGCPTHDPLLCRPGGENKKKIGPPECYEAPVSSTHGSRVRELFGRVAQAWREGRHTVVVIGERFSLK
jgi:hypothetical protein